MLQKARLHAAGQLGPDYLPWVGKGFDGRCLRLLKIEYAALLEAVHLGVRQRLTSRIVIMRRPSYFRDSMMHGAFKRMDHDHIFESTSPAVTVMKDVFDYISPLGVIGKLADWLFLERDMRRLLEERNQMLKQLAESTAR